MSCEEFSLEILGAIILARRSTSHIAAAQVPADRTVGGLNAGLLSRPELRQLAGFNGCPQGNVYLYLEWCRSRNR
jgi:hypothetical protein